MLDRDKALRQISKMIIPRLETVGAFVTSAAQENCPVDTGNLKGSINYKVDKENLSVRIGTNVEYGPYVEFGTGEKAEDGKGKTGFAGQKPQPFLRPALNNNKEEIEKILYGGK